MNNKYNLLYKTWTPGRWWWWRRRRLVQKDRTGTELLKYKRTYILPTQRVIYYKTDPSSRHGRRPMKTKPHLS